MRRIAGGLITLLISGFFGAALIRFSPGYEFDEIVLDPHISKETAQAIARENRADSDIFLFYGRYLKKALHGDFGYSRQSKIPTAELIRDRSGISIRLLAEGLSAGWAGGLVLAILVSFFRSPPLQFVAEALSGAAVSLPAAVFALVIFLARGPVFLVLALAVLPRVFRYSRDLFDSARMESRVEAARTRGLSETAIFWAYIMRPAWPPLVALAGVSFSIAFAALIPVEVVCDIPGIGHLAWKAAQARDLPVLVTLTLLVTAITVTVNGLAAAWSQPAVGATR